jgi:flagellar hook-associated protein 3 FlgL
MLAGLDAFTSTFLSDLNTSENRITQASQQLSSGYRVNQASDDPGAIEAILGFQSQIDQVTQTQSNLTQATTIANVSDSALASASNMLDQLTSIAAQASSYTATAASRSSLAQQVQGIEQELVTVANTTFGGRYVFGGDNTTTPPYTFNATAPGGVVRNNTSSNTVTITNSDGGTLTFPSQTAQQIFDSQTSSGTPAASNIFQNVYALTQALQNNDQTGVQNAAISIQASVVQLGQATTTSGNSLDWLQQSSDAATSKLTNLQTELAGLRDADVAQAATDLSSAQTAEQAAIAAHGSLQIKSLFSYLG